MASPERQELTRGLFRKWFQVAGKSPWLGGCRPTGHVAYFQMVEHARVFAAQLRRTKHGVVGPEVPVGLVGGQNDEGYQAKHFCRNIALCTEKAASPDWKLIPFSIVAKSWTPDQRQHCRPLEDMSSVDVVRRFGMSPWWVSCWLCFFGNVTEETYERLVHADARPMLRKMADDWHTKRHEAGPGSLSQDIWPPSPMDIMKELKRSAATAGLDGGGRLAASRVHSGRE